MNKVILIGRLTKDPEVRYSQSAEPIAVAKYTLAVNRKYKREGEPDADFINCIVFGKNGEFAEKYFKKGMLIAIVGSIRVRSYEDQSGQKKWVTEVVVDEQNFTESKAAFEASRGQSQNSQPNYDTQTPPQTNTNINTGNPGFMPINESIDDEDLPF